jgi:lysozyme
MHLNFSDKCIDLIKRFEGLELEAYPDTGTGGEPWTIGYGHTGPDVFPGLKITELQAEQLLAKDLEKFEKCVNNSVRGNITQGQFDSLISFTYNVGCGALGKSILLRCLNNGDDMSAAQEFTKWVKAGGKTLPGLVKRRTAEMELFLS